jgi:hypothetical protein
VRESGGMRKKKGEKKSVQFEVGKKKNEINES